MQVVLAGYADKMDAGSSVERTAHVMTNRTVLGDEKQDSVQQASCRMEPAAPGLARV